MKMKMRMAVIWMLALSITLCTPGFGLSVRRVRLLDREGFFKFAADGADVYIADEDGVWLSRKRTDPVLIAGIEGVYEIDAYAGGAYLLHEEGGDWLVTCVLPDGSIARQWLLPEIGDGYFGIAALEEHIALLAGEMDDSQLYFLDRATGSLTEIEGAANLSRISRRNDESVLASGLIYGTLLSADAHENIEELFRGSFYALSAAESEDGIVMFGNQMGVYTLVRVASPTEFEEIGAPDIPGELYGAKIAGDHLYMDVGHTLYQIALADFAPPGEGQAARPYTITIALDAGADDYYLKKPMTVFKQTHADTDVKAVKMSDEEIMLAFMSGAQQYDLMLFSHSPGAVEESFARADVFEDMSAYPAIMEQKRHWIDVGLLYDDRGRFVRVPTAIAETNLLVPQLQQHERHRELGIELNGKAPTYDEFRALAQKARESGDYLMLMRYEGDGLFYQYAAFHGNSVTDGVIRFDTSEFREMMTFWKQMHDEDLIGFYEDGERDPYGYVGPALLTNDLIFERNGKCWTAQYVLENDFLYMPTADGVSVCTAAARESLYMNRYGAQKERAAEFVALFMSPEIAGSYGSDWWVGDMNYLNDISLYADQIMIEDLRQWGIRWVDQGRTWEYYPKFENFDLWIGMQENMVHGYSLHALQVPFREMFKQYLKDEVDLETFVSEMERHADIWMNE